MTFVNLEMPRDLAPLVRYAISKYAEELAKRALENVSHDREGALAMRKNAERLIDVAIPLPMV